MSVFLWVEVIHNGFWKDNNYKYVGLTGSFNYCSLPAVMRSSEIIIAHQVTSNADILFPVHLSNFQSKLVSTELNHSNILCVVFLGASVLIKSILFFNWKPFCCSYTYIAKSPILGRFPGNSWFSVLPLFKTNSFQHIRDWIFDYFHTLLLCFHGCSDNQHCFEKIHPIYEVYLSVTPDLWEKKCNHPNMI